MKIYIVVETRPSQNTAEVVCVTTSPTKARNFVRGPKFTERLTKKTVIWETTMLPGETQPTLGHQTLMYEGFKNPFGVWEERHTDPTFLTAHQQGTDQSQSSDLDEQGVNRY